MTRYAKDAAKETVLGLRGALLRVEQQILLGTVQSYMEMIRAAFDGTRDVHDAEIENGQTEFSRRDHGDGQRRDYFLFDQIAVELDAFLARLFDRYV